MDKAHQKRADEELTEEELRVVVEKLMAAEHELMQAEEELHVQRQKADELNK
jgi:hypothetical protein